ncbi:MAG: metal ABC transporter permease [Alistipes inops]
MTTADIVALGPSRCSAPAGILFSADIDVRRLRCQFAEQGVATGTVSYVMAVLVALAVVFCIRSVGIVLLISLLTVPAVIVNSFTKSFTRMAAWSSVVAVTGNIAGLYLSYVMDIPAGAATIFLLALTLIIIKLLPLRSRKTVAYSENPR